MNADQLPRVCRALCARAGKPAMWTDEGPTDAAVDALAGGGGLSSGERLLVRVAFDVYNGRGDASLGRVIHTLDDANLAAVGLLLVAVAGEDKDVERWLAIHDKVTP